MGSYFEISGLMLQQCHIEGISPGQTDEHRGSLVVDVPREGVVQEQHRDVPAGVALQNPQG